MNTTELKALLRVTNEVAILPVHVEASVQNNRNSLGQIRCPMGLVKATVIENNYSWTEKRTISACGDTEYSFERKNGVLVEIDPDDLEDYGHPRFLHKPVKFRVKKVIVGTGKNTQIYPHAEVITRDGKEYIHLITSRKAIFASWGEYALERAKNEKEEEESERKYARLYNAQAALMGLEDPKELDSDEFRTKYGNALLNKSYYKVAFDHVNKDWFPDNQQREVGAISITIEQAEKILDMLTDEQKAKLAE